MASERNPRPRKRPGEPKAGRDETRRRSPQAEPAGAGTTATAAEAETDTEAGTDGSEFADAGPLPSGEIIDVDVEPASPATGTLAPLRDPLARFLAEARRYRRLSEDEERALGGAVRDRGDMDAARTLVVHNLRLVIAIAYQYRRAWTNILDLFQEGSVGLMEAVKRWEPTLGPRFGSYAAYWIRAYVLRFLMTNSRLIHVGNTRAGRKLYFRLEKERQKLLAAGFEATPKLLAAKLEVGEKELDEVRQHLESREVSLDPQPGDAAGDEGYPLSERIAAGGPTPEAQAARDELAGAVQSFMGNFRDGLTDERERAVWREHLAAEEPVPLGELGARFGVTKQRMGQIADQLKRRFRTQIVDKLGPDIKTDFL